MSIFIGYTAKKNGNYGIRISNKLCYNFSQWVELNSVIAKQAYTLTKLYKKANKTSGSLAEKISKYQYIKDLSTYLRVEYSKLPDNDKNPILLEVIENYQFIN